MVICHVGGGDRRVYETISELLANYLRPQVVMFFVVAGAGAVVGAAVSDVKNACIVMICKSCFVRYHQPWFIRFFSMLYDGYPP